MKEINWNPAGEPLVMKDSTGRPQTVSVTGDLFSFTFHAPEGAHFEPTKDGFLLIADSKESDTPTIV